MKLLNRDRMNSLLMQPRTDVNGSPILNWLEAQNSKCGRRPAFQAAQAVFEGLI